MVGSRPFQKLNLCDHLGSHPNTSFHLLGSEALTPPAGLGFGKIDERAGRGSPVFEPFGDFTPCRTHESGAHTRCVNKTVVAVETHDQRIDSQIAGNIAAHHELLPEVHPILAPESGPLARLVDTVSSLGDRALEAVAHELQHLYRRPVRHL